MDAGQMDMAELDELRAKYKRLMIKLSRLRPKNDQDHIKRAVLHLDLAEVLMDLNDAQTACFHTGIAAETMLGLNAWDLEARIWQQREWFWILAGLPELAHLDSSLIQAAKLDHGPPEKGRPAD